ncbi:MAG: 16S rRNA (cytosine(1402)-N(4))-methyltransferase [Flavobacteriales bacterium MED-G15]|nr:MAG: 16S rRNA (cytosine(1402)-N(4))-methyltransferase [Flavobacteriales bacterium MED-G15]|tara:strand:- start:2517 stop:3419 length:903 start_codon:yes stop_codon:yes gene_type:complete
MKTTYHKPVMLHQAVQGLKINPDGVYVDVTFGGGGHSRAILNQLNTSGKLFAFDQDQAAFENQIEDDRFKLIKGNFADIQRHLRFYGIKIVDGILADFGVSSHQFNSGERGFSTRFEGPLDMRMSDSGLLDANQVVNEYSLEELRFVLKQYGELRNAHNLASAIVKERTTAPISTTQALVELFSPIIPKHLFNKIIAQVFQAIRIEVNNELDVIKSFLKQTVDLLKENGRLVCISYHSLEDRLVKNFIREGKFEGFAASDLYGNKNLPFKKVGGLITPTAEEIKENSRSRSGKLRIAVRL